MLLELQTSYPRIDEVVYGAEVYFAKRPTDGIHIANIVVWYGRVGGIAGMSAFLLYYTFTPRILYTLTLTWTESF
jgi:hypothetical protein